MGSGGQLRLLLWKDYLIRKRHPGLLLLTFGWAVAVFMVLYIVRESLEPDYVPTCQFKARALPSAGLLPFVQSFICNIDNKCESLEEYEHVPQYKAAKLGGLAKELGPLFSNDSVVNLVYNFPKIVKVFTGVAETVRGSNDLSKLFKTGIKVSDLFKDPENVKRLLISEATFDKKSVEIIFNASINYGYLLQLFTSTNMADSICDPKKLAKFLLVSDEVDVSLISNDLCNLKPSLLPNLLRALIGHLDFGRLFEKIGSLTSIFTNYDFFKDLQTAAQKILSVQSLKTAIPVTIKLDVWVPKVIPLLKHVNGSNTNFTYIHEALEIIEPTFKDTNEWSPIKKIIGNFADLMIWFQRRDGDIRNELKINDIAFAFNETVMVQQRERDVAFFKNPNATYVMFQEINKFVAKTEEVFRNGSNWQPFFLTANILDGVRELVPQNISSIMSNITHFYSGLLLTIEYSKRLNDGDKILYESLTENPKRAVDFENYITLVPEVFENVAICIRNYECTDLLVKESRMPEEFYCDSNKLETIFGAKNAGRIKTMLCEDSNWHSLVKDTLKIYDISTTIEEVFPTSKYPKGFTPNFKTSVELSKHLFSNVQKTDTKNVTVILQQHDSFREFLGKAKDMHKVYLINIQLAMFKNYFAKHLAAIPFQKLSQIVVGVAEEVSLLPAPLALQIGQHYQTLIETLLLTLNDREKTYKLTAMHNWTEHYCDKKEIDILSYPLTNVDKKYIHAIICEMSLVYNLKTNRIGLYNPIFVAIKQIFKTSPENTAEDFETFAKSVESLMAKSNYFLRDDMSGHDWKTINRLFNQLFTTWNRRLDFETGFQITAHVATRLLEFFDVVVFGVVDDRAWMDTKNTSRSVERIIAVVNELAQVSLIMKDNNKLLTSGEDNSVVLNNAQNVLESLDEVIASLKIISLNDSAKILNWVNNPCRNDWNKQLVANFSTSTDKLLLFVQNAICKSDKFVYNADKFDGIAKLHDLYTDSPNKKLHWNRNVTQLYMNVLNDNIIIDDDSTTIQDGKVQELKLKRTELQRILLQSTRRNVTALKSATLNDMWNNYKNCSTKYTIDECQEMSMQLIRYSIQFTAKLLDIAAKEVNQYLSLIDGKEISYFEISGFKNTSGLTIMYKKFGDLILTLVHSYRQPSFEQKLLALKSQNQTASCNDIMDYLVIPETSTITDEDLKIIRKYLCPRIWDLPILRDNLFLETVGLLQNVYLDEKVNAYNVSYQETLSGLLVLKEKVVQLNKKTKLNIVPPWNDKWLGDMKKSLVKLLNYTYTEENSFTRLFKYIPINTTFVSLEDAYRLMGSTSHILDYLAESLEKTVDQNVSSTDEADLKTVLNLFDFYPKDVIGILFYAYYIHPEDTNHGLIKGFRELCGFKYGSAEHLHISPPEWILKDSHKVLEKMCKIDVKKIKARIFPPDIESSLLFPINFEGIVVDFVRLLLDMGERSADVRFNIASFLDKFEGIVGNDSNSAEEITKLSQKMAKYYVQTYPSKKLHQIDVQVALRTFMLKMFKGGDWWETLIHGLSDYPTMQKIFAIVQQLPTLPIRILEAATTPNLMYNVTSQYVYKGKNALCDLDLSQFGDKNNIFVLTQNVSCSWNRNRFLVELLRNRLIASQKVNANDTVDVEIFAKHISEMNVAYNDLMSNGVDTFLLPQWMDVKVIDAEYNDYVTKNKQPLTLLQTVTSSMTQIFDIGSLYYRNESNCNWCTGATILVQQIKKHLSFAQKYVDLVCKAQHMSLTQVYGILQKDFKIDDFSGQITTKTYTVDEFNTELHGFVDVFRLQAIIFATNATVRKLAVDCVKNVSHSPGITTNINTYVKMAVELAKLLQTSSKRLTSIPGIQKPLRKFLDVIKNNIKLYKPIKEVVFSAKAFDDLTPNLRKILMNASIDVNKIYNNNYTDFPTLSATEFRGFVKTSDDANAALLYKASNADKALMKKVLYNLNWALIQNEIENWRNENAWSMNWLAEVFEELQTVLANGGSLMDIASKIDFQNLSSATFNAPGLLTGIITLVEERKIDKLFDGLRGFIMKIAPLIRNETITGDLHLGLDAIEDMELFVNLGLLRVKYNVSDLFTNWPEIKMYFVNEIKLKPEVVDTLLNSSLDLIPIISSQKDLLQLREIVCSPRDISKLFTFPDASAKSYEILSDVLCHMGTQDLKKVSGVLFKELEFESVVQKLMNSSISNVLSAGNVSAAEGRSVLDSITTAVELLPTIRGMFSKLSQDFSALPKFDQLKGSGASQSLFAGRNFLGQVSKLLCGRSLVPESNKFYKIIAAASDAQRANDYDEELEAMRTPFCKNLYKDILAIPGGKLIWSYMKPFVKGQILYTPSTASTKNIMHMANGTFEDLGKFARILTSFAQGLNSIAAGGKNSKQNVKALQGFLQTPLIKMVLQMYAGGDSSFSIDNLNLTEIVDRLGNSKQLTTMVTLGSNLMDCILINRFIPVDSEIALEQEANRLIKTNEFMAGVVFLDEDSDRPKRAIVGKNTSYKIRMDLDNVPSTSRLKALFWDPGPDADFLDNLRYFRGFVQLQDMLDNAIIRSTTSNLPKYTTYTQQMPYPCWKRDFFQTAINIAQSLQTCFFFGLMVVVASAVRYLVWEKETNNMMVMHVMGMKYWTHNVSWIIVSIVEICFAMILVCLVLKLGGILPLTNICLLIILVAAYGLSIVSFCYLISTIFNSASLAAVASIILYLLTYMPYIIIISLEANLSFLEKALTSISMSSSFCYGALYLMRYEVQGNGLQWQYFWESPVPDDGMNFGYALTFLILDTIVYTILGFVIAASTRKESKTSATLKDGAAVNNYIVNEDAIKVGVSINNLGKVYQNSKQDVKALDNINIQMFTGQVTTLLGHNGAGKTTLIKILTGMLQPSKGEIVINSSIKEKCKPGHQYIGVCPQSSVLIESLTAKEHLLFYAQLKTQQSVNSVMPDVLDMLDTMSFGRLVDEPVAHLSEGMRRRLCIAIAFIGKPSLVVLDEPSSGVDPIARRQLWELISQHKEGRTVLLTTHHLDEAEVLSDRIVILHKGKVLCSGTPLSLKHNYGDGYHITFTYSNSTEVSMEKENLMEAIRRVTPNAFLRNITSTEIFVTAPFETKSGFNNNFGELAAALEQVQSKLGYSSFAMNCTTLEQTFLSLCKKADDISARNETKLTDISEVLANNHSEEITIETNGKRTDNFDVNLTGKTTTKFRALMTKRAIHYFQDWRILVCAFLLPTLFTAIAMGFSLIRPASVDDPSMKLTPELYFPHSTQFASGFNGNSSNVFLTEVQRNLLAKSSDGRYVPYQKTERNCECIDGNHYCPNPSTKYYDTMVKFRSVNETVDWLLDTQDEYIEKRYGGWSMGQDVDATSNASSSSFVVWYNNKGFHSMPSYLNTMNNAILQGATKSGASITTYNHPIKLSGDQLTRRSVAQHIADVGIATVLLIAFSLVPASGAIYLVQERTNQEKRVQILCGVSPTLYWTVALIWDMMMLVGALILAVCVFEIFGLPIYVSRMNLPAICLLLGLYGWACTPMVHLIQRFFNDASMANMTLFCTGVFVGISQLTCILLMDILGRTQFVEDLRDVLHAVYLFFPQFCLADGLIEISKNNIKAELLSRFNIDTYENPLGWNLMGSHYTYLALMGVVFFVLNLILENAWYDRPKKLKNVHNIRDDNLEMVALHKEFKSVLGTKVAVNSLSLSVPVGECIGLIGVNGAGKSTTFKMLTGEIRPTSGSIRVQGQDVREGILYSGILGYCPQSNSLDPKLTVHETLDVYGKLRGIEELNQAIKEIMIRFGLSIYENRKVENLSGGNKRKLCAAISVLGNTSLILMDEPTSGMDPKSRAIVSREIKRLIKQNKSVVLTSHSMEECESLCTKVAILVNGNLVCQGTPTELKNKLGTGYILSMRVSSTDYQTNLRNSVMNEFPGAQLQSCHYCSSQFLIPIRNNTVSGIFRGINSIRQRLPVEDYTLVQSTLDQVFISLASGENENRAYVEDDIPNNLYSMSPLHIKNHNVS